MAALEADKEGLLREKTASEVSLDDLQRQIRESDSERANYIHLKQLEVTNMKQASENAVSLASTAVKVLQSDVELLKDQVSRHRDAILLLQKTKLKDVASLKNQHQIMKESLELSKKKLQENAELLAVNSLFKKLKINFEDIKVLIS